MYYYYYRLKKGQRYCIVNIIFEENLLKIMFCSKLYEFESTLALFWTQYIVFY